MPIDNEDTIDLEAFTNGDEEATIAKPGDDDEADEPTYEQVDKWMKKNGITGLPVDHPQVAAYLAGGQVAAPGTDEEEEDLDNLLVTDPTAYAAKAGAKIRSEIAESGKLVSQMIRDVKANVPDATEDEIAMIEDHLANPNFTLEHLRNFKKSGAMVNAAKAAVYTRGQAGGERRAPNATASRVTNASTNNTTTRQAPELKGKFGKLAAALAGVGVKPEDIAGSEYFPGGKNRR